MLKGMYSKLPRSIKIKMRDLLLIQTFVYL